MGVPTGVEGELGGGWPMAIPTGIEDRKKCGD